MRNSKIHFFRSRDRSVINATKRLKLQMLLPEKKICQSTAKEVRTTESDLSCLYVSDVMYVATNYAVLLLRLSIWYALQL